MYLLAICLSSLGKCPFLMGLFVFLLLSCVSLIPITHRFPICKFAYSLKCVCNPQNKHSQHVQGHSQTGTGQCETLIVQWACSQLSSEGALHSLASTLTLQTRPFRSLAAPLFSVLCLWWVSWLFKTNPRCSSRAISCSQAQESFAVPYGETAC